MKRQPLLLLALLLNLGWLSAQDPSVEVTDGATPAAPTVLKASEWGAQIMINQVELSDYPNVTIYATVTQGGQPLTGLTARDFRVREDDFIQAPLHVETKRDPLSVVMLIDVSGSMRKDLPKAQEAAVAFLETLNPEEDSIQVMTFHEQIDTVYKLGNDFEAAARAIRKTRHRGDTRLYDGINEAIRALENVKGRRAVVALGDGVDDDGHGKQMSKNNLDVPLMRALVSSIPVYTIGLGTKMDEGVLKTFGKTSGAEYLSAPTVDELVGLYDDLGQQLAGTYTIRYTSRSPGDGNIRNVKLDYVVPSAKPYAAPVPIASAKADDPIQYGAPELSTPQKSKLASLSGLAEMAQRYNLPVGDLDLQDPDQANWPAWLPEYEKASDIQPPISSGVAETLEFRTTENAGSTTGYFKEKLESLGWEIKSHANVATVSTIEAAKGELKLNIAAVGGGPTTQVTATHEGAALPVIVNATQSAEIIRAAGRDVIVTGAFSQVQVLGNCPNLMITGPGNEVLAESVGELIVSGTKNAVTVDLLGSALLTGEDNRLLWSSAAEGDKPEIKLPSPNNTVMAVLKKK